MNHRIGETTGMLPIRRQTSLPCRRWQRQRAFTLVELLITLTIILILMGLILTIVPVVREEGRKTQTRAILHAAQLAVSTAASHGVNVSPVPHPLANTAQGTIGSNGADWPFTLPSARSLFERGQALTGIYSLGDAVALNGEALVVANPATVDASDRTRVLLPTDVYVGASTSLNTDDPLLYGVQRSQLTILGTALGLLEERHLPPVLPQYDRNADGILDTPYLPPMYPDNTFQHCSYGDISSTTAYEAQSQQQFASLLGPEVVAEIGALGGIRTATGGTLIASLRLTQSPLHPGVSLQMANLTTDSIHDAPVVYDTNAWYPYAIRGTALYDRWGDEVLFFVAQDGSLTFESAGPDRCFRWNPGVDGVYQTNAYDSAPSGDDRDGTLDNILVGHQ